MSYLNSAQTARPNLPSIPDLKAQAKRLRLELSSPDNPMTHSRSLEILSHQLGFKDWNTLHAAAGKRIEFLKLALGQTVNGTYLGQSFKAVVKSAEAYGSHGYQRIALHFEDPVDVVTFESFSAFRQRVSAVIDAQGKTIEVTSSGEPQLSLVLP